MTDEYGKYKFHYCKDTGAGADVCKEGPPQQVQYNKRQQMGHERVSLIAPIYGARGRAEVVV